MPFNSKPFWWVECDNCGKRIDYGDFSAWEDQDQAATVAEEYDWTCDDDRERWACPECPPLPKGETDCRCPVGDDCPCEMNDDKDGLCACCRRDDHNGSCALPAVSNA